MLGVMVASPMKKDSIAAARTRRFQNVVMPHLDAAYNLARWLLRNDHDAEDIVQEACVRAFKSFDGFRGVDARPWLLKIVRNACFSWFRAHRPELVTTPYDDELHGLAEGDIDGRSYADPAALLAHADTQRVVNDALAKLPVPFREAVVLCDLEELSYKEIATIAGIPIGTVMSRVSRGRRQLASLLSPVMTDERYGL
jgi:RNA polymerase sigma factor (sigma-70 family)